MDVVDDLWGDLSPMPVLSAYVHVEKDPREIGPSGPVRRLGWPQHAWVGNDLDRALVDLRRVNDELGITGKVPTHSARLGVVDFVRRRRVVEADPSKCRRAILGTGRPCALAPNHDGRCCP